ncbi:general stress protein 26 [Sinorhizobium fredii]
MEPSPPLPHSLGARGPCQPGATGMANIVVFPFLIMAIEAAVERLTCPARLTLPTSRKGLPMSSLTLCDIAKKLKKIDFCMMATRASSGAIAKRPMSNNGDVEYDGDSWFFSFEETHKVSEIIRDPQVALAFAEPPSLLGKPGIFISIEGAATLIRDKGQFQEHWVADLERWFAQGVETPGLVLIKVHGDRIQYWDGEDNGVIHALG